MTKETLKRSIKRAKQKLTALEERKEHFSVHGYWDIGYLKGQISILEDWLDEIEEEEE